MTSHEIQVRTSQLSKIRRAELNVILKRIGDAVMSGNHAEQMKLAETARVYLRRHTEYK